MGINHDDKEYIQSKNINKHKEIAEELLKKDFAGQTTGTWYPDTQRYFDEGIHTFKAGVNTLKLDCPTPFPHIDKLMLVPVRQTRGLVRLLSANANALRGRFTQQWAAFLKKTDDDAQSPDLGDIARTWVQRSS
mgnify:CR=1 FL=1